MEIRCKLSDILSAKGMSQKELADKTGIPQSTISVLIRNKCEPSAVTMFRIAKALDVTVEDLFEVVKKKHTGYERVAFDETYHIPNYCVDGTSEYFEENSCFDDYCYESANYHSNKFLAENNMRADKLMRQLRRFAVEHREKPLDWNDGTYMVKYFISYDTPGFLTVNPTYTSRLPFLTYFDSKATAKQAIEEFHDELTWYFTEYKDSL